MSNPICPEPGCGREMKPLRLLGIPVYTCCPANRDEHRIAALESALSESEAARRELERRLNDALLREENDPTIEQRDEAESAMSEAYELVMDEYPEWSSAFGFREALDAMNERLGADARNRRALAEWKDSALAELGSINLQAVSKALGVPLGEPITPAILPGVRALAAHNAELRKALEKAEERLKWVSDDSSSWIFIKSCEAVLPQIRAALAASPSDTQRSVEEGIRREALDELCKCPKCGLSDCEISRSCHNSACENYATEEPLIQGWNRAAVASATNLLNPEGPDANTEGA